MNEEKGFKVELNQNEEDQLALSELKAFLPGALESFLKKLDTDNDLKAEAAQIAANAGTERNGTIYMLLEEHGPGFKQQLSNMFHGTSWDGKYDTLVMESIGSIMDKAKVAKLAEDAKKPTEEQKNEFRINRVDELLNKKAA